MCNTFRSEELAVRLLFPSSLLPLTFCSQVHFDSCRICPCYAEYLNIHVIGTATTFASCFKNPEDMPPEPLAFLIEIYQHIEHLPAGDLNIEDSFGF